MLKGIKSFLPALDVEMSEVLKSASVSFLFRIIGAIAQFSFTVLLARMFGADGLGLYVIALSLTVIASNIGRWGLDQAALKYIAISADKGEWGEVRAVFGKSVTVVLAISSFVGGFLFFGAPWLSVSVFDNSSLINILQLMTLSVVPFSLLNLVAESLRALKHVGLYTFLQGVLLQLLSILMLVAFYYFDFGLSGAAYSYIFANFICLIAGLFLWKRCVRPRDGDGGFVDRIAFRHLFSSATPMAWITIISAFMGLSETLLLGFFYSPGDVGVYSAALRLALLVNFFIMAFNSILAPKFAALKNSSSTKEIYRLSIRSTWMILILTSPIFLVYFVCPEFSLMLFSDQFRKAANVLRVLAFGQLINVYAGPLGMMFLMTSNEHVMRKNVLIYSVSGIVSGLLLIPAFGVIGAAWSFVIGLMALNIGYYLSVKKIISADVA